MTWVDIRENGSNKLLARFCPSRGILEIVRRGIKTVIDLTEYVAPEERQNEQNTSMATDRQDAMRSQDPGCGSEYRALS